MKFKFKKKTRQLISIFVLLSLLLTLAVSNSVIVYAADDFEPSYGYTYFDENGQVKVLTGAAAEDKISEIQEAKEESPGSGMGIMGFAASEPTAAPTIVGVTTDRPDLTGADVYNFNTLAEYLFQNALEGNYGALPTGSNWEKSPGSLDEIVLSKALTKGQIASLITCIYTYFPHFISISNSYVNDREQKKHRYFFQIVFPDTETGNVVEEERERAKTLANQIKGNVLSSNPSATNRDIADAINDWLILHCEYDHEAAKSGDVKSQHALYAMDGIEAGKMGSTVCAGYANAFALMCQYAGLNVVGISGKAGGPHRWNWVLDDVNDEKVIVDVTWNDPTVSGTEPNNLEDYQYFWETDLTTKSFGSKKARTWDKAQDSFIAYINNSDELDAVICNGIDDLTDDADDELVLYVGGGKFTTPHGGIVTTNTVQLAAYEAFNGELHDYAKSKSRTWMVTTRPDIKPTLNGKNYETDKTIIKVAGGKVTAVAPGTVYLWYIGKDTSGVWFDKMAKPIKVTVKVAPTAMSLSTNNTFDATNGSSGKPIAKATAKFGGTPINLYFNAFNKKGKVITSPDADLIYTLKFAKPADAKYLEITGTGIGTEKQEDSYLFNSSVISSSGASTIQVKAVEKPPKNMNVVLIMTCNKTSKTAKFTVTIQP